MKLYNLTGIIAVVAFLLLFILEQPYWAYDFGVLIVVGIIHSAIKDIMRKDGELDPKDDWT